MPKAKTDSDKLRDEWLEHSDLARITVTVEGTTRSGETVPMGIITIAQLRRFAASKKYPGLPGSVGFNINAKLQDTSPTGLEHNTRFQLSGNMVAVNSRFPDWIKPK